VTDQAEHFTGLDAQVGRPQRRYFAAGNPIGFMDLLEFDHGRTLWVRSFLAGIAGESRVF